jgi:hypothetical protein
MNNQLRHVYTDFVCLAFLVIGFGLLFFMIIPILISIIFLVTGIIGMMVNEKINPFFGVSK